MKEQVNDILLSAGKLIPELWLLTLATVVLLFSIFSQDKKQFFNTVLSIVGLIIHLYLLYIQPKETGKLILGNLEMYSQTVFFKFVFTFSAIFSISLSFFGKRNNNIRSGEYLSLLLFLLLGLHFMSMAANFLMLYLSIEIVSFSSYMLTYFNYDKRSVEGSMKYLLFGAFSTAFMLYGISLIYAFTNSLQFETIGSITQLAGTEIGLLACGLLFIGLLFKLAAFPFQGWAPDVYEAAPTPFVAFLSIAPKAGAIFIFCVLWEKSGLAVSNESILNYLVAAVAMLSILFGNLSAVWQTSSKRLLAYSSIAHTGFILIPIFGISNGSMASLQFYVSIFLFMNFAAFSWVYFLEQKFGSDQISLMKGSAKAQIFPAILILITMISLTGLPITAGFTAKLLIFSTLWEQVQSGNSLMITLFTVGIFNVLIALYYYLKMPYFSFFKTPPITSVPFLLNKKQQLFLSVMVFPLVLFFFKPDWLLAVIDYLN
ncbi:NADH-quinone oxidoreductase subunit N [Chondrinema litorale]|uniref:NADH-quinone oxidoreductase subunit N n=1 Tax=Chondrinema litorale TaxID=2994555 RepID=UPI002542D90F|nr:NADH-quinone oxidoreductase subunit N [Chondrinema litorale]UZR95611.1 NADH-quinone oxidoreductase subunit N [Chondrinema litorale]